MFVVDVPEGKILQHTMHVRHLEEDHGVVTIAHRAPYGADKVRRIGNVLQRHLAAYEVALDVRVFFSVEVGDELNMRISGRGIAGADKGRVKPYPCVLAHLAHQGEKLTLPASDLDNFFAVQIVLIDQFGSQAAMKRLEC